MIHFVLHEHHRYAVGNFLETWGRELRPRVRLLTHQDLRYATRLARGTYVFGDMDRLSPDEVTLSAGVADALAAAGCRVLNHPARVAWRYELCRRVAADGLNAYRCFRATDDWSSVRLPAFVRRESDHGSLKREVLHDFDAVRRAIRDQAAHIHDLLVVEYLDTRGPDGLFRKYSALRIGDQLFARHVLFSREWVVKYADLVEPHLLEEELRYLDNFGGDAKHRAQVERAFELAGVEYGRIDYSLSQDGRPQVWEINLSPHLSSAPAHIAPGRLPSQATISARIAQAIGALDESLDDAGPPVALHHDAEALARLGVSRRDAWLRTAGKVAHRFERLPGIRQALATYRRSRWLAEH